MTATDAPTVTTTHTVSFPKTVDFGPFRAPHVTPTCDVCGVLGQPSQREDAEETRRDHLRDVALAAVVDDECAGGDDAGL